MNEKKRVLFLCTGNSCRSQMAEALLRKHAGDRFEVFSAGLEPKGVNPLTIQVMEEAGIDMSQHTSKNVSLYLGKVLFHTLITVCDHAEKNCPSSWPGVTTRLHWSFEDPAAFEGTPDEQVEKFRQTRDLIEKQILDWLN